MDLSCTPIRWTSRVGSAGVNEPVVGRGETVGGADEVFGPCESESGDGGRCGIDGGEEREENGKPLMSIHRELEGELRRVGDAEGAETAEEKVEDYFANSNSLPKTPLLQDIGSIYVLHFSIVPAQNGVGRST